MRFMVRLAVIPCFAGEKGPKSHNEPRASFVIGDWQIQDEGII
jgi:hypothetical protein